ncbi:GGDEF domain-containing protein [Bacillus salipaludis]|uniref:sensor domain-containing diguanylate cyclase n=1 Tax=Bacillus salipaludis TaxID=2547811 RepID=UPI002E1B2682|nr:GGDEF domain-containing protein [Bacillus salipaludis]
MLRSFTKKLLNRSKVCSSADREFFFYNDDVLFERLKLVSYMLIFTYPAFFIVDFFLLNGLAYPTYKKMLAGVHISGLMISLIFIVIYRYFRKDIKAKGSIIHLYVFFYLLIGAVSSLNSQLLTGNLYAYIIILIGVAVIFPVQPEVLLKRFTGVHLLFVLGLFLLEQDRVSFLIKLINSTGAAVISFTIALAFYSFRKNDFLNKRKLSRNEEVFRRLFNLNPNPLFLINPDNNEILLMNHKAVEYFQLQDKDTDGSFLFRTPKEKDDIFTRLKGQGMVKNIVTEQQITPYIRKWSMLHFELVDYLDQTCMLIGTTDITDIKKTEEELERHASYDMLTGVKNRRIGIEQLRKQVSGGSESEEFILSFIDINDLKKVNDRLGHASGDDLIKTCCETLKRHIDHHDVFFRLGGDEFIILFFKKKREDVEHIWGDIQRDFEFLNEEKQKPFPISVSHGLYHYVPGAPITVEEILETADQEMYKEKSLYKAREASFGR